MIDMTPRFEAAAELLILRERVRYFFRRIWNSDALDFVAVLITLLLVLMFLAVVG